MKIICFAKYYFEYFAGISLEYKKLNYICIVFCIDVMKVDKIFITLQNLNNDI